MSNEIGNLFGLQPPEITGNKYTDALDAMRYERQESNIRRKLEQLGWASPTQRHLIEESLECFIELTYSMAERLPQGDPTRKFAMEAIEEQAEEGFDLLPYKVARYFEERETE